MNFKIIGVCNSFGVDINGSEKGPIFLFDELKKYNTFPEKIIPNITLQKCINKDEKIKNLTEVTYFNSKLYNNILNTNNNDLVITIGGDHSNAIGSSLASIAKYNNLGIIWIDAHGDFNNFDSTPSGNIHGLPLAAITGFKNTEELISFHNGNLYNPKNSVIVGARSLDEGEIHNLNEAGITIFSSTDIEIFGIQNIMKRAIKIASDGTYGIHVSFDIDVIDPVYAPGVSTPVKNGISKDDAYAIINILKNNNNIKSLDLVEFNPNFDKQNITLKTATNLITKFMDIT